MKIRLIVLWLCLVILSCSNELSPNDFKELNHLKAPNGQSTRTLKALKFEELYNGNSRETFKEVMFDYLKSTDEKNISDYFWYSTFLISDSYMVTNDKELALELLQEGKKEIELRLENKELTEEQSQYLAMSRCQVLWASGIYYFNENDLNNGGYYFDLANENPRCIHAFPASTREKNEEIAKKYAEYKKKN